MPRHSLCGLGVTLVDMTTALRKDLFLGLTPDRVLAAVEAGGFETTGVCYPLNSFENRVYEVELRGRERVVAKFYRPGRWRREQILAEHAFLAALAEAELPVGTMRTFPTGGTLEAIDGVFYALSDRRGGRAPDELTPILAERLGMLIGRMHAVASRLSSGESPAIERPRLDVDRYVHRALGFLDPFLPSGYRRRYVAAAEAIGARMTARLEGSPTTRHAIHADLHLGNVLVRDDALVLLDFDDMAIGPPVQDLWLAVPGRDDESLRLRDRLIAGYERFRAFDPRGLALIEPLRGLRMIRYAGWLARRFDDPAFKVAWPHFGGDDYWRTETADLEDQLDVIDREPSSSVRSRSDDGGVTVRTDDGDPSELTNKDYFWDWEDD